MLTLRNFKAGSLTSGLKFVCEQPNLKLLCCASKKLIQELRRDPRVKWEQNRGIRQSLPHFPRIPISWLYGISKLASPLQNWSFVCEQQIFRSLCSGSNKLRLPNQLTNLWGSTIFLISICLMRWLRQPWRSFSTRSQTSSDMPSEVILDGLYKSNLEDSVQLQTVLALYDQQTVRNNGQTIYNWKRL